MFEYKPKKLQGYNHNPEIGSLVEQFECFEPNPKYAYGARYSPPYAPIKPLPSHIAADAPSDCPPITPVRAMPPHVPLPMDVRKLIKALWKRAEPAQNAQRGAVRIGASRYQQTSFAATMKREREFFKPYQQHVSPTKAAVVDEGEMALDWKEMDQIRRITAYTFRGDRDGPSKVLITRNGFKPPATRTDRSYLEGAIYEHFAGYMKRRYSVELTQQDFLAAVDQTLTDSVAKQTLIAYMIWRKLVEGEKYHLGRMTIDECLKAYISTSTSLPVSMFFATGRVGNPGWMYVTLVHGGFAVPKYTGGETNNHKWATGEHELAKLGPIPPQDIVGFRHVTDMYTLDGPVYFRSSFRQNESHPFARIFDILSGMPQ